MAKVTRRAVAVVLVLFSIMLSVPAYAASEEAQDVHNDCKIIFAVDSSGSMSEDSLMKISDAVGMFLGMLPEQDTMAGCLTFNTDVVRAAPLQSVSEMLNKETVVKTIQKSESQGDTAIAVALNNALNMLGLKENVPESNAFVILLTDGDDDYENSGFRKEDYERIRSEALETTEKNSVTVLTVAIAPDASTDLGSLEGLASDASCSFRVSDITDLNQYFRELYSKCFSTCSVKNAVIDGDNRFMSFFIPRAGITDTNIVISSDNGLPDVPISRIEINHDDRKTVFNERNIDDFTIKGETTSVTKLPGKYTGACTVYLNDGISIDDLNVVYNDCLDVQFVGLKKEHSIGRDIGLKARLFHQGEPVINTGYEDYSATLKVLSPHDTAEVREPAPYPMVVQNDTSFYARIPKSQLKIASYTISAAIESKYTDKQPTTVLAELNVINHAPYFRKHSVKEVMSFDGSVLVDLSDIIADPDGDALLVESPGNHTVYKNGKQLLHVAAPGNKKSIRVEITVQDAHQAVKHNSFVIELSKNPLRSFWFILLIVLVLKGGFIFIRFLISRIYHKPKYTIEIRTKNSPAKKCKITFYWPKRLFYPFRKFQSGISVTSRFHYKKGYVILKSKEMLLVGNDKELMDEIRFEPDSKFETLIRANDQSIKLFVKVTEEY